MRYSSQVKPISYLKANAAEVLLQLAEHRQPMLITQNGEARAVLARCGYVFRGDTRNLGVVEGAGSW